MAWRSAYHLLTHLRLTTCLQVAWLSAYHLLLTYCLLLTTYLQVAWLSAYRFARRPPTFVGLDDVVFKKPVEVQETCMPRVGRAGGWMDGRVSTGLGGHGWVDFERAGREDGCMDTVR